MITSFDEDGMMIEGALYWNALALLRQIGVVPPAEPAARRRQTGPGDQSQPPSIDRETNSCQARRARFGEVRGRAFPI